MGIRHQRFITERVSLGFRFGKRGRGRFTSSLPHSPSFSIHRGGGKRIYRHTRKGLSHPPPHLSRGSIGGSSALFCMHFGHRAKTPPPSVTGLRAQTTTTDPSYVQSVTLLWCMEQKIFLARSREGSALSFYALDALSRIMQTRPLRPLLPTHFLPLDTLLLISTRPRKLTPSHACTAHAVHAFTAAPGGNNSRRNPIKRGGLFNGAQLCRRRMA